MITRTFLFRLISLSFLTAFSLGVTGCGVDEDLPEAPKPEAMEAARLATQAGGLAQSDPASAYPLIVQASELAPDVPEYRMGAGMLAADLKDWDNARKHFQEVEEMLREQANTNPARVDDHAVVLARLGRMDDAKQAVQDALSRFPNDPAIAELANEEDAEWLTEVEPLPAAE